MNCVTCKHWIRERRAAYSDGSTLLTYQAPDGMGHCYVLERDTAAAFGCVHFAEGVDEQVIIEIKHGAPWQNWRMVVCPDCGGNAGASGGACDRCAGTGNVRGYDDGFIGDEQKRKHPTEIAIEAAAAAAERKRQLEAELAALGDAVPPPPIDPGTVLQPMPKASALT